MASSLPLNSTISHYRIVSRLGAGGMGEVYLAEDIHLGRKVAMKILLPDPTDQQARKRLIREAQSAAILDHPNICTVHEVGEDQEHTFIIMQYVDGETLAQRIERKPLELFEVLGAAVQVADALSEAHSKGIIHRDIKPQNILINSRDQVKVLDFGLAKVVQDRETLASIAETQSSLTGPGIVQGTLPYMSPEQLKGEPLDSRSDIFSFGVVLYEMIAGRRPFSSEAAAQTISAILSADPPLLTRYTRDVPPELERIVYKALNKGKENRYQTMRDVLTDLRMLREELQFANRLQRSETQESSKERSGLKREGVAKTEPRSMRFRILIVTAVVVAIAFGSWFYLRQMKLRWAVKQVPRLETLARAGRFFEAYDLALVIQKHLPNDAKVSRLMATIADSISLSTEPAGARLYLKRFAADKSGNFPPRIFIGLSPVKDVPIARGGYLLYIEKEGYSSFARTISGGLIRTSISPPIEIQQKLTKADLVPPKTVFVSGGDYRLVSWSRPTDQRVRLADFFIDQYEVSNQDYKDFINSGGYLKKQFWKYPFFKDSKSISWEEARQYFKDHTGLPGPRNWSSQNYAEGKADYPVTDITWYEAAAFAEFKGKKLPSIFQWEKAARNGKSAISGTYMPWGPFHPGDNLENRVNFTANGTVPVNHLEFGMGPFGCYNMAGNVAEWALNESSDGFITAGGSWGTPTYVFSRYGFFPGFYASGKLGFRCVAALHGAVQDLGGMRLEVETQVPVYPVSSEADFQSWLRYYEYDQKAPLTAKVSDVNETAEWRRETIAFGGANGERALAYLYLPKNFSPPFQVIQVSPPSHVADGLVPLTKFLQEFAPYINSGRAIFGVVVRGHIERPWPANHEDPEINTVEYRELIVQWVTDMRRGLDYLETRKDIDINRIALAGISAGAGAGLILAAVEPRYHALYLEGTGLRKSPAVYVSGTNRADFAPHITAPKLMLHGKYDEIMSLKTEAEPLYRLFREPKRLVLYEGGHIPPVEVEVPTLNRWLDEILGPIKQE